MTNTMNRTYTAVAGQAREATERSVEVFKKNVKAFTDRANVVGTFPAIDVSEPVAKYFDYVQQTVDLNRELAIRSAALVTALFGAVRAQADKIDGVVNEKTDKVADLTVKLADEAEHLADEQAEAIAAVEEEQARLAGNSEREQAEHTHDQARAPYEALTKAELSEILSERDLPKSGTVEELIERLVSADTE
jgi:hypothetical protein